MSSERLRGALISDFNVGTFAAYLTNDDAAPLLDVAAAPFGNVIQSILDPSLEVWQEPRDFAVVWTTPAAVSRAFAAMAAHEPADLDRALAEVDELVAVLEALAARVRHVFVALWVPPQSNRGLGLLDLRTGVGLTNAVMRMNLRLIEGCERVAGVHALDTSRWTGAAGRNAFSPKLWYMAKVAFGNEVFRHALPEVKAALATLSGKRKKLLCLDLDGTLWGGIVGETGWEGLRLGGHDPVGEAYVDFQRWLKALSRRGILLAIVSKNEEGVALEAIRKHPEMVLREDDFAGWRINWSDKARNIQELVTELNLGIDSVVFFDDSAVERDRVRRALPEVLVVDTPKEPMLYRTTFESLHCFDTASVSVEDAERTRMYVAERTRKSSRGEVGSLDAWLASLDLRVTVEPLNHANLQRATQLLNKTNQMNLSTRRMNEAALEAWASAPRNGFWCFRVTDKFGDYGLTGAVGIEIDGDRARLSDYVLSCRVMGRKVEETLLHYAVGLAAARGAIALDAKYLPTAKNKPCVEFFERSGMDADDGHTTFRWSTARPFPLPDAVRLAVVDGE